MKAVADRGQGRGQQQRSPNTLGGPGQVKEQQVGRGTTRQRGQTEQHQAEQQHAPPAKTVGQAAGGQQAGGEGQHSILNEPVAGRACVLLVIRWCEQEVIGVLCVGSMQ